MADKLTNEIYEELLAVGPFTGIDNTTDPYYLQGGVGVDSVNIMPDRTYQSYVTAQGRYPFGTAPLGTLAATVNAGALFKFNNGGNGYTGPLAGTTVYYFIVCSNNNMYSFQINSTTPTLALAPIIAGIGTGSYSGPYPQWVTYPYSTPYGSTYSGIYYSSGAGYGIEVNFNGTTSYSWQIPPPLTGPTPALVASTSGGPLNTALTPFSYRYTYQGNGKESSPSPITSGFVDTTGQNVSFTVVASTDPQVTGINVYRLGGSGPVWTLTNISNGTNNTTIGGAVDNSPDPLPGQNLVFHRDMPPYLVAMEVHKDHIWGIPLDASPYPWQYNSITNVFQNLPPNGSDIWFSNQAEPWGWDNTNQVLAVGHNEDGDIGVGLATLGSLLLVFKQRTTWAVYGDTGSDFLTRRLFDIGCMTKYSIVKAYGVCFWLSPVGIYSFDGSDAPTYLSQNIKGFLDTLSLSDLIACVAFCRYRQIFFSFPTKNVTYLVDIDSKTWSKLGFATNAVIWDQVQNEVTGSVYNASHIESWFTLEGDYNYTNPANNALTSSFTSRISDSGQSLATKQYRYLVLQAFPVTQQAAVTVTLIVNPGPAQTTFSNTFNLNSTTVNQSRQVVSIPPGFNGNECQIIITCSSLTKVTIQKVSVIGYIKRRLIQAG